MMRPNTLLAVAIMALVAFLSTTARAGDARSGYVYYSAGDIEAAAPASPSGGLLLIGGSDWSTDAWRWFGDQAGNGHLVILRASQDGADGEWIMDEIGNVASVQTLVFSDREAASDETVLGIVERADGIFIAGGDQSNYVRFWKDSPLSEALNAHIRAGKPIGGTSAGLAILGATSYGAMATEAVDTREALADPHGEKVTLVRDFLDIKILSDVVTDTHFHERDRLGRLIAFLAQERATNNPDAVGLGIDEDTALAVEADGTAKLFTSSNGYAWLVRPSGLPTFAANGALQWDAVEIIGIGPESLFDLGALTVADAAFSGTASVRGGELFDVPEPPPGSWALAIHGGSGVVERGSLSAEMEARYRAGLNAALATGATILRAGGSSLDAVEATVRALEDNPLFNAGKGAVFDAEGRNQLDASIMDGDTLNAGAVAGVGTTRNPVSLARAVMEKSRHVMLSGDGADEFARLNELEQVDQSYFWTEERWRQHLEWKRDNDSAAAIDPIHLFGTVGAVALDRNGHFAAATSTGGLTGKMWGRIGDSPIIGAGTYAYNGRCAVSGTGTGEYYIRESAARQVCDRVAWKGETIREAANGTIRAIGAIGGDGGLVAMDQRGRVAFAMNTEGMYRGLVSDREPAATGIFADEPLGE